MVDLDIRIVPGWSKVPLSALSDLKVMFSLLTGKIAISANEIKKRLKFSLGNNSICTNFIFYKSGVRKIGIKLEVLSKSEHKETPFEPFISQSERLYGVLQCGNNGQLGRARRTRKLKSSFCYGRLSCLDEKEINKRSQNKIKKTWIKQTLQYVL